MKVGEQSQPAVNDSPSLGPKDVVRAVLDFQRGVDREESFELLFRRFRPRLRELSVNDRLLCQATS